MTASKKDCVHFWLIPPTTEGRHASSNREDEVTLVGDAVCKLCGKTKVVPLSWEVPTKPTYRV